MRVLVWPADLDGGSGWYRMRYPAYTLAAQGEDVTVDMTGPTVGWDRQWSGDTPPLDARALTVVHKPDADVVVIQRPGRAHWAEIIPHLQARGIRVVCDVDDDFDAIPAGNVARDHYDPKINPRHSSEWIHRACDLADLVTVSTPHLAGVYGKHGRVKVLPNLVPAAYLTLSPVDPMSRTIGWSGSVATHPGDLETVGTAVRDTLAERPDWSVYTVGTGAGVAKRLRIDQVDATGKWLPFGAYPAELARVAVGIVPLERSRFNRGKSALKMCEMAAVGVPVVAANTPDNQRMHAHGVGLLADSPSTWRKQLDLLTGDDAARAEVAAKSREAMAAFTYEQWADLWMDAWETALDRQVVAA
jgi:glycosyltransferase involved in cell wall biosynthesis